MLQRDLGIEVTLEAGPYGSLQCVWTDDVVVDAGALAFLGCFPASMRFEPRVGAPWEGRAW
jgi:hypothetical protein